MNKSRNTRQRAVILDILAREREHPTAEAIYREARKVLPRISLGTVYRNLNVLRDQGRVREVRCAGAPSSRFEGANPPHAHFHCVACGDVLDLPLPACLRDVRWESEAGVRSVAVVDLHLAGSCARCSAPASAV